MLVNVLGNPVNIFLDNNGEPLQGGSIYIGNPNTDPTNPANQITVFQDQALSIPLAQPIKTNNGQPWLNGSQIPVYLGLALITYSIAVMNAAGVVVMSLPSVAPFSLGGTANGSMIVKEFISDILPNPTGLPTFTAGVTTSLPLSSNFGSGANVWVDFDGTPQHYPDDFTLPGTVLQFANPIPVGVQKVYTKGGATTVVNTPAAGSIVDSMVSANAGIQSSKLSYLAANTATTRTVQNRLQDVISLMDFGAVGNSNGTTGNGNDDTFALNTAISVCNILGKPLYVPTPPSMYRITSTINLTGNFAMYGDGVQPYSNTSNITTSNVVIGPGSWFYLDHANKGFSAVGTSQPFSVTYKGIGTIRNQPTPNGSAAFAPSANDWDFYNSNADLYMDDVFCLNPTKLSFTTGGGRAVYRRLRGQPLTIGIYTDTAYDVCHYDYIHFWPWWSQAQGVYTYMQSNASAFVSARNDNPQYSNIFTYSYQNGILITSNTNGNTSRLSITNGDFDFTNYGVHLDGTCAGMTGMLTNVKATGFGASANHGAAIDPGATGCELRIVNSHMANFGGDGIRIAGNSNQAWLANAKVEAWNLSGVGFPAFFADSTCKITFSGAMPFTAVPTGSPTVLGGAGSFGGLAYSNQIAQNTDASGNIVVTHNLGAVPEAIQITSQTTGASLCWAIAAGSQTATQFTVHWTVSNTAAAFASSGVQFNYTLQYT